MNMLDHLSRNLAFVCYENDVDRSMVELRMYAQLQMI